MLNAFVWVFASVVGVSSDLGTLQASAFSVLLVQDRDIFC